MKKIKQLTMEQRLKQVISRLKNENAKLREDNNQLKTTVKELSEKLEKALLCIEELQKYVFRGKKKDKNNDEDNKKNDDDKPGSIGSGKRDKESYRRPVPNDSEVSHSKEYHIDNCPDCDTPLSRIKILEFYEEDIIPIMDWFLKLKKVTKIKITTGYCPQCKKRVSAIPIPKQRVSIGENIKHLVVFQLTVLQLSYSQILDFLESYLHFNIANGEIANILSQQAMKLKPVFDDLTKSIRESKGIHMDETSYNIAFPDKYSGNYAWAMTSIEIGNNNTVFLLGKNRGKGNAIDLLGDDYNGVGVTDDYGVYTNTFKEGKHALCWAHPHRKFKDLKNSNSLQGEKKEVCKIFYKNFSELYQEVKEINQADFKKRKREKAKSELMPRLKEILKPSKNDPAKLKTLKKTMLKKIDRYFVCITAPNVPTSNNKAERSLRHLVIKRKKSFGSKTPKGAETMSILYSVVMSLWWKSKKDFFKSYSDALS